MAGSGAAAESQQLAVDLQPALQCGAVSRQQAPRLANAFARLQLLRRCILAPQAATHAWRSAAQPGALTFSNFC